MPSFDTVLEPNLVEVRNAVDQAAKEIGTRFDFKGSSASVELEEHAEGTLLRYPVGKAVGNVRNDGPELVEPVEPVRPRPQQAELF